MNSEVEIRIKQLASWEMYLSKYKYIYCNNNFYQLQYYSAYSNKRIIHHLSLIGTYITLTLDHIFYK